MLARYGRQEDESQQVHWPPFNHANFLYVKNYFQAAFEPMEFWGTVSDIFKKDGPEQLPAEDDSKVVRLATAMLIFFIVCIILLIVYLLCRWTAILTICVYPDLLLQRDADVRLGQELPVADPAVAGGDLPLHPRLHRGHDPQHAPLRGLPPLHRLPGHRHHRGDQQ